MMNNSGPKDISCEEALKRVFDYLDDFLEKKSRKELERHLEACRHCFDRVSFERELIKRLIGLKAEQPSARLKKRIEDLLEEF